MNRFNLKLITSIFFVLNFTVQAFAGEAGERDAIHTKAMEHYYDKKLKEVYEHNYSTRNNKLTASEKLIERTSQSVSIYMLARAKEGKRDGFDFDYCSGLCVEWGSSHIRTKLALTTSMVNLSSETKDCQKYCKSYQLESYAFLDGIDYGLSQKNVNETCSGAINSSDRNNFKAHIHDTIPDKERSFLGNTGTQK